MLPLRFRLLQVEDGPLAPHSDGALHSEIGFVLVRDHLKQNLVGEFLHNIIEDDRLGGAFPPVRELLGRAPKGRLVRYVKLHHEPVVLSRTFELLFQPHQLRQPQRALLLVLKAIECRIQRKDRKGRSDIGPVESAVFECPFQLRKIFEFSIFFVIHKPRFKIRLIVLSLLGARRRHVVKFCIVVPYCWQDERVWEVLR